MKRNSILTIVLALVLIVSAACGNSSDGEKESGADQKATEKIKISITAPGTSTWVKGAEKWSELVAERSDGQFEMEIFPNEELSGGDPAKGIQMIQQGSTEAGIHSTLIWTGVDQRLTAPSMPWIITDYEAADEAMQGEFGETLFDIFREKDVEPLAFGEAGFRQVTNNKRSIETPEDIKGLTIRVPGTAMYTDLYKALGADPTTMDYGELMTSLQQGAVDGQENSVQNIYSAQIYEVQDYLSLWNYSYDPIVLTMNKELFDSWDEETQKMIKETAQEAFAYQVQLNRDEEDELLEILEEEGMTINEVSEENIATFRELTETVYEKYEEVIGADLLEMLKDLQ